MKTLRTLSMILAVAALASTTGCKKPEDKKAVAALPPATGEGAPARAELPAIEKNAPPPTAQPGAERTTGTTFPKDEAKVGPKLSGTITKIFVDVGDKVKKGQPLFSLDNRSIALARDQAAAGLRQAEVNLRATQVEYDRTKQLFEQNAVNRAQMDQMQARLDAAKVMVDQAKVGVAQANQALADSTTRSPLDGVVTMKLANEGEMATMMPPTIVLVLQDQSILELKFRMPERALAEVREGASLKATFAAVGVTKEAKVVRISPSVDAMTRTVEIVADIDNKDGQLKPGMLADVELAGKSGQAVPTAPAPVKADATKAAAEAPKSPDKPAQEATR